MKRYAPGMHPNYPAGTAPSSLGSPAAPRAARVNDRDIPLLVFVGDHEDDVSKSSRAEWTGAGATLFSPPLRIPRPQACTRDTHCLREPGRGQHRHVG
jgi:hypothetical protein